jgi:hypothetical protein
MTPEEVWRRKSDEEVEAAGAQLNEYIEEGERIIRAEMHRRGVQQPGPITRPDVSSVRARRTRVRRPRRPQRWRQSADDGCACCLHASSSPSRGSASSRVR